MIQDIDSARPLTRKWLMTLCLVYAVCGLLWALAFMAVYEDPLAPDTSSLPQQVSRLLAGVLLQAHHFFAG